MTTLVSLTGVQKSFGRTHALTGLDLSVTAGEVHGLLGPNGAGKSTTIRILLGLIRPDAGRVTVLGRTPWNSPAAHRARLAYVPGDVQLWPNLSGGEIIDLLLAAHLTGPERERVRARRADLIARFELDPTRKARTYSKGNRQKVALVAAFAAGADLLILDEPTSGLDPLMEAHFKGCVEQACGDGATVLLSSHILSEAEQLCDRVTVVRAGAVAATGTLEELRGSNASGATLEDVFLGFYTAPTDAGER
ncbi:ABC transporter ATP-binding protein [Micrococcales bacterium 31B]|nr:ABC transporter ATP-binding protein [Micrococcales bacterium 31B]